MGVDGMSSPARLGRPGSMSCESATIARSCSHSIAQASRSSSSSSLGAFWTCASADPVGLRLMAPSPPRSRLLAPTSPVPVSCVRRMASRRDSGKDRDALRGDRGPPVCTSTVTLCVAVRAATDRRPRARGASASARRSGAAGACWLEGVDGRRNCRWGSTIDGSRRSNRAPRPELENASPVPLPKPSAGPDPMGSLPASRLVLGPSDLYLASLALHSSGCFDLLPSASDTCRCSRGTEGSSGSRVVRASNR
mmetsp:Transcript_8079/g.19180  ORF Transcript_8079/g.19180 Transcript_8079/m.19180 type:complete len:252 (+) Transcript_8079:525-1280(+)